MYVWLAGWLADTPRYLSYIPLSTYVNAVLRPRRQMLIYDVGMTGEWLGETEALAELAGYLNMTEDVALLKKRQADMAAKVQSTLWSAASQIYLNYQVDTQTFNTVRDTPLFEPFVYINDHFTKTGSGQT
jgi:hypothetical protein